MLPNGIRSFVHSSMRGRELCGNVKRIVHEDFDQCIEIRLTGTLSALSDFESFLGEHSDAGLWSYEMTVAEYRRTLPHHEFTITKSGRGAKYGANSDEGYDYVSVYSGHTASSGKSNDSRGSRKKPS